MEDIAKRRVLQSIEAFKDGKYSSLNAAALAFEAPPSTVRGRAAGARPKKQAHGSKQLLSPNQEDELVKYLLELDLSHRALSHARIR